MSHTVTVTRTTTTTSTSAIILNTGYCKTLPGILKIAEIILGAVIIVCLIVHPDYYRINHDSVELFKYIAVTFFIGSLLLLIGCLISISTGSIIAKTSYEFIYHGGAFILYAISTIWFLLVLRDYSFDHFKLHHISSVLGLINSVLYCISCILAYRSYRWP